ncbi:MAG: transglutaminase domain-containing protein [Niabella sp.]
MPVFKVKHITHYTYNSPAVDCTNQIMLFPIQDPLQNVVSHNITITGTPPVEIFIDYFGNRLGMFSLIEPHNELVIISEAEVITYETHLPVIDKTGAEQWGQLAVLCEQFPYIDFMQQESFEQLEALQQILDDLQTQYTSPFAFAKAASEYIYNNFKYKKGITSVETNVDEIWRLKGGVCQDFAHILLLMLRKTKIPARYVSGYICPKDRELRGEGATHAWVEAYIPDYGWIGLDPTNNCIVSDRHIRLAIGRNFSDCTPVKGTYRGSSDHVLEVLVSINNNEVAPVEEIRDEKPMFLYKTAKPANINTNSYRQYMEQMEKQQQQQQQQ